MRFDKLKNHPNLPTHIGIIADGNGRWAKKRGLPRSAGHKVGFETLKNQIKYIHELGIKCLSIFCFSKENWGRSEKEVEYLMDLYNQVLEEYEKEYLDKDVRIVISGDLDDERLPKGSSDRAKKIMEQTKHKTGFIINSCINYGGRQEILKAVNEIIACGEKDIDVKKFEKHLYSAELPPLDLVIRTSGEQRTSNFMPWQSTYSEWYFAKVNWPSFSQKDLVKAISSYLKRNRRFGEIKE